MIAAHSETVLEAPVERIWERLTDIPSWEKWIPLHGGWPDGPPQSLAEGTQFRQRMGHVGIHDTVEATVAENTPNQKFVLFMKGTYGADARITFTVEPVANERTRVRVGIEILGKLARPLSTLARIGLQTNLNRTTKVLAAIAVQELL